MAEIFQEIRVVEDLLKELKDCRRSSCHGLPHNGATLLQRVIARYIEDINLGPINVTNESRKVWLKCDIYQDDVDGYLIAYGGAPRLAK